MKIKIEMEFDTDKILDNWKKSRDFENLSDEEQDYIISKYKGIIENASEETIIILIKDEISDLESDILGSVIDFMQESDKDYSEDYELPDDWESNDYYDRALANR